MANNDESLTPREAGNAVWRREQLQLALHLRNAPIEHTMGRSTFDELLSDREANLASNLPEPTSIDIILRRYIEWSLHPFDIFPDFEEFQASLRQHRLPCVMQLRRSSLEDAYAWPPDYLSIVMGMIPYLCQAQIRGRIQRFARLYPYASPPMRHTLEYFWYATYLWGMIGDLDHPRPFGIFLLTYPNLFDEAMGNPRYRFTNLDAVMPAGKLRVPDHILVLNSPSDLEFDFVSSPILSC